MVSLRSRNKGVPFAVVLGIVLALPATLLASNGRYSLLMEWTAPDAVFLETLSGHPAVTPGPDRVVVAGVIDHEGFFIEDISRVTVRDASGARFALIIDGSSVIREFGGIVSLRCALELPAAQAAGGGEGFRLVWGPEVVADNVKTPRLRIDPGRPGDYLMFTWRESLASGEKEETPFSSIVVIADSTAHYHFLWYLLPMGLIFLLLSIRKSRAHHRTD